MKQIRLEHGPQEGLKIVDGILRLSPEENAGMRIGISGSEKWDNYELRCKIRFPSGKDGFAGFLIRRNGKPSLVHITANGKQVGLTNHRPKPEYKNLPGQADGIYELSVRCGNRQLDISVNGEQYFALDSLQDSNGGIAFYTHKTPVEFSDVIIIKPESSEFKAVENAIYQDDFSRPVVSREKLQLSHGKPATFQINDGTLKLLCAGGEATRVSVGNTEDKDNYKVSARLRFMPGSTAGNAGFLVRRNGGKSIYVFLEAPGNAVGISGVGPKPKTVKLPDSGPFRKMEITCLGDTLAVDIDGTNYFKEESIGIDEGGIAFICFKANVEYDDVLITPVEPKEEGGSK